LHDPVSPRIYRHLSWQALLLTEMAQPWCAPGRFSRLYTQLDPRLLWNRRALYAGLFSEVTGQTTKSNKQQSRWEHQKTCVTLVLHSMGYRRTAFIKVMTLSKSMYADIPYVAA
jgi:hypothetical protein